MVDIRRSVSKDWLGEDMTLQTGAEVHEENQLRGKDNRMTCKGKWLKTKFTV